MSDIKHLACSVTLEMTFALINRRYFLVSDGCLSYGSWSCDISKTSTKSAHKCGSQVKAGKVGKVQIVALLPDEFE